ncbi:MAG: hypothetical protein JW806_03355 [Sedimentisphaerales bacterium]|nr:hypothetical protein [Sedimentisphaerales bacterium]
MKELKKNKHSQSKFSIRNGIVYVWAIIVLLLLLTTTGLSLDIGKVIYVGHQLQNAADAAALAGARVVKYNQPLACQEAAETALQNAANGQNIQLSSEDIVVGRYNLATGTFTPTTIAANAIQVTAKLTDDSATGPVSLNFGSIFNINTCNLTRTAIAYGAGGTGAGMISLARDGIGLSINGDIHLTVEDGAILVNSEDDDAVRIIGQPDINALELDVVGDVDATGGFEFDPNFPVNTGMWPNPDPLCPDPYNGDCLPEPVWDPDYDMSPSSGEIISVTGGTAVFEPGYYSGGFNFTGGDVVFKPGIYILDGSKKSGLVIGGNTNVCAKGVMFYVVGDGIVNIDGSGSIELSPVQFDNDEFCDTSYSYPPGTDFSFEEVGIYQARTNTNEATIVGTGSLDLNGTLYFPENQLNISGNGDGFGDQLIAKTIEVSGGGYMVIRYDGRNRTPANRAFLVK